MGEITCWNSESESFNQIQPNSHYRYTAARSPTVFNIKIFNTKSLKTSSGKKFLVEKKFIFLDMKEFTKTKNQTKPQVTYHQTR